MRNHSFPGSLPRLIILLFAFIPAALTVAYPLKPPLWIPETALPSILINGIVLAAYYLPETFWFSCTVVLLFFTAIFFYRRSLTLTVPGARVLYLSLGDGSDLRTSREISSLACAGATVDFLGMGSSSSPRSLFRYLACSALLLVRHRYHSVHIAGERLLMTLWPFLWLQRQVVADLFEPVCVRSGLEARVWKLLRKFLYLPATTLIVPDESCFRLSPDKVKKKMLILPDFPPPYNGPVASQPQSRLTIFYYGQLGKGPGTEVISGLLDSGKPVRVLMAGRITDKATERLSRHPAVKWMGPVSHPEALRIAATQSDFLICPDGRINGKYESLSGIYDAIQAEKPVITHPESLVSRFANCYPACYVMPSYKITEFDSLYNHLLLFRKQFTPLKKLKEGCVWSKVEKKLIYAHKL